MTDEELEELFNRMSFPVHTSIAYTTENRNVGFATCINRTMDLLSFKLAVMEITRRLHD